MKLSNLFNILFLNAFLFIFVSCETPVEEIETDRNALSATDSSEAVISKNEEQPSAKEVDEININDLAESELPKCSENFPTQALGQNNRLATFAYNELPIESSFPATIFNHVEGLNGDGWVNTDVLSFSEDKLIQFWATGPNARIAKNVQSKVTNIVYANNNQDSLHYFNTGWDGSSESIRAKSTPDSNCRNSYYATTHLKAGESISFSIVNSVYGNRVNAAVIAVDGVHYLFKAHSKDYRLEGGHNIAASGPQVTGGGIKHPSSGNPYKRGTATFKCSGNLIETKNSKNFGCKDHAQRNYDIKCFEEDQPDYNNDYQPLQCRFYDGMIVRGENVASQADIRVKAYYFTEQLQYFENYLDSSGGSDFNGGEFLRKYTIPFFE